MQDRWLLATFCFCFACIAILVGLGKVTPGALEPLVAGFFGWIATPPKFGTAVALAPPAGSGGSP